MSGVHGGGDTVRVLGSDHQGVHALDDQVVTDLNLLLDLTLLLSGQGDDLAAEDLAGHNGAVGHFTEQRIAHRLDNHADLDVGIGVAGGAAVLRGGGAAGGGGVAAFIVAAGGIAAVAAAGCQQAEAEDQRKKQGQFLSKFTHKSSFLSVFQWYTVLPTLL